MLKPVTVFTVLALKDAVARHCIFGMDINEVWAPRLHRAMPSRLHIHNECEATLFSLGINVGVDYSILFPLLTPINYSA